MADETPPTPSVGPQPQHRSNWLKWLGIALGAIVFAGAGFGVARVINPATPTTTLTTSTPTTPTSIAANPVTEKLAAIINFNLTASAGGAITNVPIELSLTAPTSWRSQLLGSFAKINGMVKASCNSEDNNSSVRTCPVFSFLDNLGQSSLNSGNNFKVYDLDSWLSENESDAAGPFYFAALSSKTDKQAAFQAVLNLNTGSPITRDAVVKILLNPFHANAAFMGISNVEYVQSADGQLKGYAFIATEGQDAYYLPTTYVVLAGKIKGASVLISGQFIHHDAESLKIAALDPKSAAYKDFFTNQYKDGYKYGDDTLAQHNQVLVVVKSLRATAQ